MILVKPTGDAANSKHYQGGEVEPIDLIISQKLDFLRGSIVKYACRNKGTNTRDMEKIKQYADWIIQLEQKKETIK